MLNKEVFFNKMDKLINLFPNWKIQYDNPEAMKLWYEQFKNMTDSDFIKMVDNYVTNENRYPTIAGLKQWDITPKKTMTQIRHEQAMKEQQKALEREHNART